MNLQPDKLWRNGKARAKLPDAVLRDARRWQSRDVIGGSIAHPQSETGRACKPRK
jgi:hypothetical protein